ncbi:MAG: enoyl-CoA hydratase/isomerase family protein [Hyphomonadaceae bacterium]|nr:enoyl-CoA hydratase/isomerase family protein [Hyphomonadaceae bacterium]GIK50162.1 MAG: 2-(1,2-epoxy-1,2-dihydrophenyl)acetyl-CoA isomerase [Alphaproteobacteria bacterium]
MDEKAILTEFDNGVLWIRLNRPGARNAFNRALGEQLLDSLIEVDRDPKVRCAVIIGSEPAFCAGDDIGGIKVLLGLAPPSPGSAGDSARDGSILYLACARRVLRSPKPILAAINGPAAGAGTEFACAADLRLASSTARIGSGLISIGQMGNAVLMTRLIGPARATALFLDGSLISAEEAKGIGLVDYVFDSETFEQDVRSFALRIASLPTKAIGLFKETREKALSAHWEVALGEQEKAHWRNMAEVEDSVEGARAFLEKRKPHFVGR